MAAQYFSEGKFYQPSAKLYSRTLAKSRDKEEGIYVQTCRLY